MSQDFLGAEFNVKLFDFVITKNDVLNDQVGLSTFVIFGNWKMYYSTLTPLLKHSTSSGAEYYFLGTVFELDMVKPTNSIGHYIGIEFNIASDSLRIFRSRNSFLGIYFSTSEKSPFFWGNFFRTKQLVAPVIDSHKIETFFTEGIVSGGSTLFTGIHQLGFQKQAVVKEGLVTEESEPSLKTDSPLSLSAEQFLNFTMDRFAQWFKYCPYNSIAVSGGADSRLLLATLNSYPLGKEFTLHSRCHPQLTPSEDADVFIAKQSAEIVGRKHSVQLSQGFPSAYLSQEPPAVAPVLSGLYGGELLGGELLQLVSKTRLKKEDENSFAEAISISAQMFICDFYGGAWSLCSAHHNLTLTPYWDSYFVASLLQTPTDVIKKYSLMAQMYEHLPSQLKELPFVSVFTDYHPKWKKSLTGINPKSLKRTQLGTVLPTSWLKHKNHLSDQVYTQRAETLWFYFKAFYGLSDKDLLSLL